MGLELREAQHAPSVLPEEVHFEDALCVLKQWQQWIYFYETTKSSQVADEKLITWHIGCVLVRWGGVPKNLQVPFSFEAQGAGKTWNSTKTRAEASLNTLPSLLFILAIPKKEENVPKDEPKSSSDYVQMERASE